MTHIRTGREEDLPAISAIYDRLIVDSHISFDEEPWPPERRRRWLEERSGDGHVVLVAEEDGRVVGFASSGPWRDKAAYRRSVETSIALAPEAAGRGVGSRLLAALLARVGEAGMHRAYALITLPNEASVALHRKLGYREVGVLEEVGYKLGRYWSTLLLERKLEAAPPTGGPTPAAPPAPPSA